MFIISSTAGLLFLLAKERRLPVDSFELGPVSVTSFEEVNQYNIKILNVNTSFTFFLKYFFTVYGWHISIYESRVNLNLSSSASCF
jgi:hypothetical protein